MFRLFRWIRTNILYGAVTLIPVAALILVAYYLYTFWTSVLTPLTQRFGLDGWDSQLTAIGLAVGALVAVSFVIGLIVRTRFGSWTFEKIEDRILTHLPGYGMVATLLRGFADDKDAYPAALVTLQPGSAAVLGFVMEDTGTAHLTIFVPSAPMMTVGQIYSVAREQVEVLPESTTEATSALTQWGVGLQPSIEKARLASAQMANVPATPPQDDVAT